MTDVTFGAGAPPEVIVPDVDGTPLSVRRISRELVADPGFQSRFPGEVSALRGLNEPWLAAPTSYLVDDAGQIAATLRRYVQGMRLSQVLDRHPRGLDTQTVTVIAWDVLTALTALHARSVGHRNVTAENIVIDAEGVCVLVDVGLATRTRRETMEAAVAEDLAWLADLIMHCLAGRSVGHRRRMAPRLMGAWLPWTVSEPLRSLLRNVLHPAKGVRSAAAALEDLSVGAIQIFDADWDERARERLVSACRVAAGSSSAADALPYPPASDSEVTRAVSRAESRAATRAATRAALLPNFPIPLPIPAALSAARRATHRRPLTRPISKGPRKVPRGSVALAILGAGTAVGVYATLVAGHPPKTVNTLYATSSTGMRVPGGRVPGATGSLRAQAPVPGATSPSAVRTGAPTVSAKPTQPTATLTTTPPATVLNLTIIELVYEGTGRQQAVVVVQVNTSGTGQADLTLRIAGSNLWGGADSNPYVSVPYSMHGQQSYLVTYRIDSSQYCSTEYWGVTAASSSNTSGSQYAQLVSPAC